MAPSPRGGRDCAVWKVRADGLPDPAFGNDGVVVLGSSADDQAVDVVIPSDPDRPMLVLAQAGAGDGDFANLGHAGGIDLVLAWLDPRTGAPRPPIPQTPAIRLLGGDDDDEFIVHLHNFSEPGARAAPTGDGGMVIAAMTRSHDGPWGARPDAGRAAGRDVLIFKLRGDGGMDPAFAGDGFFRLGLEPGVQDKQKSGHDFVFAVTRHPSLGFLFSGYTVGSELRLQDPTAVVVTRGNGDHQGKNNAPSGDIHNYKMDGLLFALDHQGRLVDSFGERGVVLYGGSRQEKIYDVAVLPDGRIVTAGRTSSRDLDIQRPPGEWGGFDAAVFRFHPNGALDPSFGNGGVAVFETTGNDQAQRVIPGPDGRLLVLLHSDSHHFPFTTPTRPSRFRDGFLFALGENGGILARTAIAGAGDIKPTALLRTSAGDFIVSGFFTEIGNDPNQRRLLVKHILADAMRPPARYRELARFHSPDARQGVAVDAEHIYVIGNASIGAYSREDYRLLHRHEEPEGDSLIHLNAGVVKEGRLWTAHSNYPEVPMLSSIEGWAVPKLVHQFNHSFGASRGSLTWIDRLDGQWYACFAHYANRAAEPGRDPSWTQLARLDKAMRVVEAWSFPAALVERFGRYSSSGGAFGPDGRLYITGHDHRELYVLEFPQKGSILEWVDSIPFSSEGQAFAFDPVHPWRIYSILKRTREVIIGELDILGPPRRPGGPLQTGRYFSK